MFLRKLAPLFVLTALAGCGKDDDTPPIVEEGPRQCGTAEYVAFDAANHANQDLRVAAFADMTTAMAQGYAEPFSPATAAAKFSEAQGLYENTAELRAKVQGRTDDHFDDKPNVGMEIDAVIMEGFEEGKTATTALAANLAKQKVEKTMIRFFYLSIYHEMVAGKAKNWDEGYGYYGANSTNQESSRKGFSSVATKRDSNNGTSLAAEIFNGLVDGSCELAKALDAADADSVDWKSVPALKTTVETTDRKMQEVLAYSAGHEAFDMVEIQAVLATDPDAPADMWIKLAELDPYFAAIEPLMIARGGESAARATRIRAQIDAAWADRSGGWMAGFEAQMVIDDLEAEYGIDVRG